MSILRKIAIPVMITMSLVLLSGCLSSDVQVKSHTAPKVNLDGYHTYAWLSEVGLLIDENNEYKKRGYSVSEFIKGIITRELIDLDRMQSDSKPDFYVSYVAGVDMNALKELVDKEGKKHLQTVPEKALAVVLIDAQTNKVIWASHAQTQTSKKFSDAESKERLEEAIEDMFDEF